MALIQRAFTGYPYGLGAPGVDMMAVTNPVFLPQAGTKALFTITGGPIEVQKIFGICTTAVPAIANATKLQVVATVNNAAVTTDLCLTADITGLTTGSIYSLVTSTGTAAAISTTGFFPIASATLYLRFVMNVGVIQLNCAGSDGNVGQIQWYLHYKPLSVGVSQAGLVTITSPLT